jgi:hypothetical protein
VSLPISVPAQAPRSATHASGPALTTGRAAVTSVASVAHTLDTFSEPPSIPRSFSARSALVWGGVVLAIAGAALWLATRGEDASALEPDPHLATPAQTTAVQTTATQKATSPVEPATETVTPKPEPAAEKPSPSATRVHETRTPSVTERAAAESTAKPASTTKPHERDHVSTPIRPTPTPVAAPAQDTRPKPNTSGRAGRPQSTEF